jgi:hypothetical protein
MKALCCAMWLSWPMVLAAQTGVAVGGEAGAVRVTMGGSAAPVERGPTVGGLLSVGTQPVFLTARYTQGSLTLAGGTAPTTFVLGQIQLGLAPTDWLSLSAGPLAFALETPGIERWVLWEGDARLTAPVIGGLARSYVEVRHSFAAQSTLAGSPSGSGIGVGLLIRAPFAPVSAALSYHVDHAEIAGGTARTMDQLWLTVRLGSRDIR